MPSHHCQYYYSIHDVINKLHLYVLHASMMTINEFTLNMHRKKINFNLITYISIIIIPTKYEIQIKTNKFLPKLIRTPLMRVIVLIIQPHKSAFVTFFQFGGHFLTRSLISVASISFKKNFCFSK